MRVGGLASDMDVDRLVDKLMKAERKPLEGMEQDQTKLEWKRDNFRDINKSLMKLNDKTFNMKMSDTYRSKSVSSSQESAVTATNKSGAPDGSYQIEVKELAEPAINVGKGLDEDFDPDEALSKDDIPKDSKLKFVTYNENGVDVNHEINIDEGDTVNSVLDKINEKDTNVRAFYDNQSNQVFLESTRTGEYNTAKDGKEIEFDSDSFFNNLLGLDQENEKGGSNATFSYNGETLTSRENSYELNDITFEFKDKTDGAATVSVTNDTDDAFDSIMDYVDEYNDVVETLNDTQKEEKHRDYKPLIDEQKEEMSEKEIELWEEKAKSGILRGESAISGGLTEMRQSWYSDIDTGGEITSLTQLGITTSKDYLDGGKLVVEDEVKLKEALEKDPDSIYKLFSNNEEGDKRGIMNRLDDAIGSMMNQIERQAGNGTDTLESYSLGKEMKRLDGRIDSFKDRMTRVEDRYWDQFTSMEKSIQQMNEQSDYFMQQFGEAQ